MLVNTAGDLDAVRTNQSGTYALGTNITLDPNQPFTPIPNFTGLFDGQGQTIANLTIASTTQNIGLFGIIASAGEVRNLNLTNVSVNSSVNSQLVGTLAGTNAGTISNVSATGIVQVAGGSTAGGLVGQNLGSISNSFASVDVGSPNVANLQVGGLVGNNSATILSSVALGTVQAGDASVAGGLVASNSVSGAITGSQASGNVTVGAASVGGGLVGANAGTITDSTASGAVTSTGANSTVGALVGTNTGTITNSTGSGVVTSPGANSTVSGLVEGTGGVGSASNPPAIPNTGIPPLPAAAFFESLPGPVQVINNLVGQGPSQLAALNAAGPAVFNTVEGGIRLPPQQQPPGPTSPQQQQQQLPVGFDRRVIDIPPPTETRFVKDEVVLQIAGNVTVEQLQAAVGRLGLTLLASENLAITGSTVVRFGITDGRSPAEIIPALAAIQLVAVAQPNYVYTLQQQPSNPVPASRGDATQGDPAQY